MERGEFHAFALAQHGNATHNKNTRPGLEPRTAGLRPGLVFFRGKTF